MEDEIIKDNCGQSRSQNENFTFTANKSLETYEFLALSQEYNLNLFHDSPLTFVY